MRHGYRHEATLLRRVADLGLCRACAAGGAWGEWTDERRDAMTTSERAETWPELPPGEHECDCECGACDPLRCRYEDCAEGHPVARVNDDDPREDDERVTCPTCRSDLGLPTCEEADL